MSSVIDLPFQFLDVHHGFSVQLPCAPVRLSLQAIAGWPGIGACVRSEFAIPDSDGSVDIYLELYGAADNAVLHHEEQRRWMAELAVRVGDGPVEANSTWVAEALLVYDGGGRSLVVAVRDGVCVVNVDATADLDAAAAAVFSSVRVRA